MTHLHAKRVCSESSRVCVCGAQIRMRERAYTCTYTEHHHNMCTPAKFHLSLPVYLRYVLLSIDVAKYHFELKITCMATVDLVGLLLILKCCNFSETSVWTLKSCSNSKSLHVLKLHIIITLHFSVSLF